jgi:molybdate transport system substrate-binding protein
MSQIRVLSKLAVMGAMQQLAERYESENGVAIQAEFAPTVALLERLRGGEAADIAILTAQGIDDMIAEGRMRPGSRTDIALSFVGLAVKAGEPKPSIATVEDLKSTLLGARAVAYSRIGASGIFFAGLLRRLGIADKVKSLVVPSGFTAERLVTGEADLAVQQVSELMVVSGIEVIGKLPPEVGTVATFSGGVLVASARPDAAAALLRFLASPAVDAALRRAGLEPATERRVGG